MNEQLIDLCRNNDRKAQKRLYEYFFGKMYAVCLRYVKQEDDALEVLNAGFFKVFKNIAQFKNQGSFEGWVKRIVINTALDFIKEHKNYNQNIYPNTEYLDIYNGSTDNSVISKFNMQELTAMINQLPPMAKAVFNMYAIDGYSHKEISDQLNISEVTSRTYLHAARQKLKMLIKKKDKVEASYGQ
ncbi:MAG: RNA polymerase sigma factor [Bacteroidetes bacterium]|nr:MAG: RNA polymerase sigma factor [Bacteroidota bacterium]